ncbi:PREDICTED: claudin-5-like [Thamnophis sirtalis]|uniref:Claudin n=1 Tax=Thamnophis sirtalis TaxID=35019 RepID=A0A6I9Z5J3_9SAUR|nr:PREDICTED: claudin-5-like [Thamnophis sirtalis]
MASTGVQLLGLTLSILGWAGSILVAALPMWQVSAFIEGHLVVSQTTWEGLWMACVVQSTGQMQCKVFDSILALSPQIQAGRTLMVIGAVLGLVALLVTVTGAQCTTCLRGAKIKDWIAGIGGALFLICGLLVLVPPSWFANTIISNFYDPNVEPSRKREMGAALYLGWAAATLLLLGGSLICGASAWKDDSGTFPAKYSAPRRSAAPVSNGAGGEYDKKNYV